MLKPMEPCKSVFGRRASSRAHHRRIADGDGGHCHPLRHLVASSGEVLEVVSKPKV